MRKKDESRVLGPYNEINRWRLVVIEKGGRRSIYCPSEEEAQKVKRQIVRKVTRRSREKTVETALGNFAEERQRFGKALPATCAAQYARLRGFLSPVLHMDVRAVTAVSAERLYAAALVQDNPTTGRPLAVATQRLYLAHAKQFFGWLVAKGLIDENPFRQVSPVGAPNVGKRQLRIEEARRFIQSALSCYQTEQRPLAIGAVMALTMGLRASEVISRLVRDLDDDGRILWIDHGKTRHARRHLRVPDVIRPHLQQIALGRGPEEPLFRADRASGPTTRQRLWLLVRRLCQEAGVTVVCPHSLRGLYATLAVETGALAESVATSLGHGSFAMTEKHYAQPSAVSNTKIARVTGTLVPIAEGSEDRMRALADLFEKLSPAERAQLRARLAPESGAEDRRPQT